MNTNLIILVFGLVAVGCGGSKGEGPPAENVAQNEAPLAVEDIGVRAPICVDQMADVTWFVPKTQPSTLVYVQHGFTRNNTHVNRLADTFRDAGFLVAAPTLGDMDETHARCVGDQLAAFALRPPESSGVEMPRNVIVVGHSKGAYFAALLGQRLVQLGFEGFRGAILLDPVDGSSFTQAIQAIWASGDPNRRGKKALAMLASGDGGNLFNQARGILEGTPAPFSGVRLNEWTQHFDFELKSSCAPWLPRCSSASKAIYGAGSDGYFNGWPDIAWNIANPFVYPRADNIADIVRFMVPWSLDMAADTPVGEEGARATYYPGGPEFEAFVNSKNPNLATMLR